MNEEAYTKEMTGWLEGRVPLVNLSYARIVLLFVFDEPRKVVAEWNKRKTSELTPFMIKQFIWALAAIACLDQARHTRNVFRKALNFRQATKLMRNLEAVAKGGSANCIHLLQLVRAEIKATRKNAVVEDVLRGYDTASITATKTGFRMVKAIALQRAGDYVFETSGDKERAQDYLQRSFTEYQEFGALGKLAHMQQKYKKLCDIKLGDEDLEFGTLRCDDPVDIGSETGSKTKAFSISTGGSLSTTRSGGTSRGLRGHIAGTGNVRA